MTVTPKVLIAAKFAENAQTTQYSTPASTNQTILASMSLVEY